MSQIAKPPCDEAVIASGAAISPCSPSAGKVVLAATILGSAMAFIDGTVVNIAIPVLQRELGASVSGAQWVMEAYSLVLAALILVGGSLGDRYGRRRVFVTGVALFTVASVVCGLAPNLLALIVARTVQGIGAALLTPQSLALISASFEGEERGRAIGTWSGFTSLTAAAGPVIGGGLIALGSWRYAFFLNVPIAVATLWLTRYVPESRDVGAARTPLDWLGAVLATIGLGGLVYGFVTASSAGFAQPDVLGALAGGGLTLAAFILAERRSRAPMMPLHLFATPAFAGANLFTFLLYAGLGGALFFFPFDLIQVQGYSPAAAGAALLPFIALMFLLSRWSGGLVGRYGARLPLTAGPLIVAAGFALFALPGVGGSYPSTFLPAVIVLGLGMAISVAPLTTTVMNAVEAGHAGLASGVNNAVARTAGVLAVGVLGVTVSLVFSASLERRLANLQLPPQARQAILDQRTKLAAAEAPSGLDPGATSAIDAAVAGSFVSGFRTVMLVASGLAVAASATAALTLGRDPYSTSASTSSAMSMRSGPQK
jgi:EmrB/QacA subfamily drug resistance transporter